MRVRIWMACSRLGSGVVPIYAAFLCVLSIGVLGFGVALWPRTPARDFSCQPSGNDASAAGQSIDAGPEFTRSEREPSRRSTWM